MRLIQIVPRLPPSTEGVGSHAEALAGALARLGIETRFVTEVEALDDEEDAPVFLHYANYGYHPRGCPTRLVEGLARRLQRGAGRRLVTNFHEVFATGPPWRSSFWLFPVQRRLAATVARLSAALITSLELYSRRIHSVAGERPVRVVPVFSTVGEPAEVPPLAERAPRLVVFGGAGVRSRTWEWDLPALGAVCAELGIEEILDVGPPTAVPDCAGAVPVRALGALPAEEVSACLLGARAGFLSYPPTFLPKSSIFAAYCAHGVAPVCVWNRREVKAGPLPPFWRTGADPAASADRAHAWYGEHALFRQASLLRTLLLEGGA